MSSSKRASAVAVVLSGTIAAGAAPASAAFPFPQPPGPVKIAWHTCIPRKDLSKSLRAKLKLLSGSTCLPKIKWHPKGDNAVANALAAYTFGRLWCAGLHTTPGKYSALSFAAAARFCGKEGRGYRFIVVR